MKILAVTDIHGSYNKVSEFLNKEVPDMLVIGGDLTTAGTVQEAESAIKQFQKRCEKIFCIAGNMDFKQHDQLFDEMGISLNCKGVIIDNIGLCGVSGIPHSHLQTPYEIPEEEITQKLIKAYLQIKSVHVKILVTHAPPFETRVDIVRTGIHVGSKAVRKFIENYKVDLVICGHIHESNGQDILNKTKIVNCGPACNGYYVMVEINSNIISVRNTKM